MVVYLGKQDGKKNEQKERVIETTGRRVKNEQRDNMIRAFFPPGRNICNENN